MSDGLDVFLDVDFNWVRPLDSVWKDPELDIPDLNSAIVEGLVAEFKRGTRKPEPSPIGQVVVGPAGIGKTHMVGRLRRRVWEEGGWFVLLDIVGLRDFWKSAALCFATSLQQPMADGRTQGVAVLSGVAEALGVGDHVRAALRFPARQSLKIIEMLTEGLDRFDRLKRLQHQDVFRALYLFCCSDVEASNLAYAWLQGLEIDTARGAELGFGSAQRAPVELVRGLSWIMSLAGPTMVAVDQIDGLVNPSSYRGGRAADETDEGDPPLVEILAAGLMELHDVRRRGMTVVSCLGESWDRLRERALRSALERFHPARTLLAMRDAESVARLVAGRLAPAYAEAGFAPPYPTWPFTPAAIESGTSLRPRDILMRCEAHRRHCVDDARVTECESLLRLPGAEPHPSDASSPRHDLDAAFARERASAEPGTVLDPADDSAMGTLLHDALGFYVQQIPLSDGFDVENRSDPAQKKPPLHGRLTFTDHRQNDRERHYCFRAIEHANAIAFQSRLGAAMTASGIDRALADRHLLLVRRAPMPGGAKTAQLVARFEKAGGLVLAPTDEDLRTFLALSAMRDAALAAGETGAFDQWLRARKPLDATAFFRDAGLVPPPGVPPLRATRPAADATPAAGPDVVDRVRDIAAAPRTDADRTSEPPPGVQAAQPGPQAGISRASAEAAAARLIPIGQRTGDAREPISLPAALLPRHTAIIAGAGSGKTVLLRRLVEEAALLGVPAIVLDPNNDLARLGDPWPTRPDMFTADDDAKAQRLADTVEVVVWTPGLRAGNPLTLSVLPDFAALGGDPDEREQAVGMAMDTLGPLAGLTGAKGPLKQGVLTEALRVFAARGGGDVHRLIALLADLPEAVSGIGDADRLAAEMADHLRAAIATNPLLRADGTAIDPERLFSAAAHGRTRISVISLSGLGSDAAKQDFVNRLQMTLFGWIKSNPSPTGRLYVMDEAQEFVPAQAMTPSRGSAVRLVAQARKYGLGMIFATQMPRGIDNKAVSNCTTHFYGKQSAPASIEAIRSLAAAKGGRADDVGKLVTGEFYFSTEGFAKPVKVRTPLCLTHHPANPLTPDEVLAHARRRSIAAESA